MAQTKNIKSGITINKQIVVFKLNEQKYALEIDSIKEVVLTPEISPMPKSLSYVKGVTNIRGTVYVVVDLEVKFNIKDGDNEIAKYVVIVESGKRKFGILVNDVPVTLTIQNSDIDTSQDILNSTEVSETYVEGIVKHDGDMIILIDAVAMLEHDAAAKL